jgi:hypothetical protein
MRNLNLTWAIFGAAVLLFSCEEENPGVVFTTPVKPLLDTTYTTTDIPAAQNKNVLLLDVTGVRCNNCPDAAAIARRIADTLNPGRVIVLAAYPFSPSPSLTAPWEGYDTLANVDAEALVGQLGAVPNLPIGCVDQIKPAGSYFLDRATWNGNVNNRLALSTPLNIDLKTGWIATDNRGRLEIKVTYTRAVSAKHLMYIAVVENEIVGKQSNKNIKPSGIEEDYVHNHALRKLYTPATGDTLNAELSAGRVFEKQFYITPKSNWNPDHLECVVWVVDASNKEVLHVMREHLKK